MAVDAGEDCPGGDCAAVGGDGVGMAEGEGVDYELCACGGGREKDEQDMCGRTKAGREAHRGESIGGWSPMTCERVREARIQDRSPARIQISTNTFYPTYYSQTNSPLPISSPLNIPNTQ